eukprot:scaffold18679_cov124-Isochrysis_galbana.AAC.3
MSADVAATTAVAKATQLAGRMSQACAPILLHRATHRAVEGGRTEADERDQRGAQEHHRIPPELAMRQGVRRHDNVQQARDAIVELGHNWWTAEGTPQKPAATAVVTVSESGTADGTPKKTASTTANNPKLSVARAPHDMRSALAAPGPVWAARWPRREVLATSAVRR